MDKVKMLDTASYIYEHRYPIGLTALLFAVEAILLVVSHLTQKKPVIQDLPERFISYLKREKGWRRAEISADPQGHVFTYPTPSETIKPPLETIKAYFKDFGYLIEMKERGGPMFVKSRNQQPRCRVWFTDLSNNKCILRVEKCPGYTGY